jgi:hypothetical protein
VKGEGQCLLAILPRLYTTQTLWRINATSLSLHNLMERNGDDEKADRYDRLVNEPAAEDIGPVSKSAVQAMAQINSKETNE